MPRAGHMTDRSRYQFFSQEWTVFQSKFKTVASIKDFTEALKPGFESRLPNENYTLSDSNEDKEKVKKNKIKNALAVHYMIVSLKTEEQLGYIKDARTSNWPSAIACNVWSTLEAEFKPSNILATSEMMKRLMVFKLGKNVDLKKLREEIAVIQSGYNCKNDETQKIIVVINAAGKIYADTIQQDTVRFEVQSVPVTARRLIKAMHENYRLKGGGDSGDNYKNSRNGDIGNDGHKTDLI